MLTAFSQRELVERARAAGAMAYLVKPFTKADLVPAVEMAMAPVRRAGHAGERGRPTCSDRLETRKLVDRAKGVLQDRHGLDEAAAYRWVQRTSMDRRLSMRAGRRAGAREAAGRAGCALTVDLRSTRVTVDGRARRRQVTTWQRRDG